MIGVVDSDIITYRAGFAAEKKGKKVLENGDVEHIREVEPVANALHNVDTIIQSLPSKYSKLEFFLTGSGNFRDELATIQPYKGNRSKFQRPVHYEAIREYLKDKYSAVVVDGMEADDAVGIRATELKKDSCIITIDKDLDQIPGHHYNWVKKREYTVSTTDGLRTYYKQLLTGDRTDHIPGIYGVGPVRASQVIDHLNDESRMYKAVRLEWATHYPHGYEGRRIDDVLLEISQLLWIRRYNQERWVPPIY